MLASPKTWAKNLIKTGSLRRFLEFSISRQKRKNEKKNKTTTLHMAFQYSFLYSQLKQRRAETHTCKITRALSQDQAGSYRNDLDFRRSFRKGAAIELAELLGLLHLLLYGALELV